MFLTNRLKLTLLLSLILFIAFVGLSIINYRTTKTSLTQEIVSSSLPLLRENIYSEILRDIAPAINRASAMAHNSFLINWAAAGEKDSGKILQYLSAIQDEYGYFSSFFISENTKNYYHYSGILKQISPEDSHDVWYYRFIESGKEYVLDVDTDEASDNLLTIFINFRIEDYTGNSLGVTGVGIKMANFSRFLRDSQEKYSRSIYLVDETGLIQAHSDTSRIQNENLFEKDIHHTIAGTLLGKDSTPKNARYETEDGGILVTSRYIEEIDWYLIVEQNEDTALRPARLTLSRTILIGVLTSIIIILVSVFTVSKFQKRLEQMAVTDELTGAANRREFQAQFRMAVSRYRRYRIPLAIILIDIDNFKNINDSFGHLTGDKILKQISRIIQKDSRPDDLPARWGGDEFVILLSCDLHDARKTAERLRHAIKESGGTSEHDTNLKVTISAGVAEYREGDSLDSLLARADGALYSAKNSGRDSVNAEA